MSEGRRIVLRKGLDLPIPGAPVGWDEDVREAGEFALLGRDYIDVRWQLRVAEGDRVRLGETLCVDRSRPEIRFVTPTSGVVRTARPEEPGRAALVVVEAGDREEDERRQPSFPTLDFDAVDQLPRAAVVRHLLETGDWPSLRERPFDRIPDPDPMPDALLVCLTDSNPLAAPPEAIVAGREDDLRMAILALSRLTDGPTFVCSPPGLDPPVGDLEGVQCFTVSGPHPAGLPGTQIHHLLPIRDGRRVWHVGIQDTLAIGRSFRTGNIDPERVVALAGPRVRRPRLIRTRLGASVEALVHDELLPGECRIVSGSPLSGRLASRPESFLGRYHHQISVLPEADEGASRGWLVPFFGRGRFAPPWRRKLPFSTERHGETSAMLPLDVFDAVVPLGLPVTMLLRALAAGDLQSAHRLGALELVEEDLALCSYLCPSKLEYGELLRAALDADRTVSA